MRLGCLSTGRTSEFSCFGRHSNCLLLLFLLVFFSLSPVRSAVATAIKEERPTGENPATSNKNNNSSSDKKNPLIIYPRRFLFRKREVPLRSLELPSRLLASKQRYRRELKMAATATRTDVFWFIPNLIGYVRILMALAAFVLMSVNGNDYWSLAVLLYLSSFVGDLFDGWAARKLDQCSVLGGLLDMVTDRCATLGFLYILAGEYAFNDVQLGFPAYRLLFLSLMILDISSHWCQMYSSSYVKDGAHHKSEEGNAGRHFLVQWFYRYYWFFGYLCVGAEFTYICLYVVQHANQSGLVYTAALYLLYACIPGCFAKQLVNVMQLKSACDVVAQHDANARNQRLGKVK